MAGSILRGDPFSAMGSRPRSYLGSSEPETPTDTTAAIAAMSKTVADLDGVVKAAQATISTLEARLVTLTAELAAAQQGTEQERQLRAQLAAAIGIERQQREAAVLTERADMEARMARMCAEHEAAMGAATARAGQLEQALAAERSARDGERLIARPITQPAIPPSKKPRSFRMIVREHDPNGGIQVADFIAGTN